MSKTTVEEEVNEANQDTNADQSLPEEEQTEPTAEEDEEETAAEQDKESITED
jgi:hypothetical protein